MERRKKMSWDQALKDWVETTRDVQLIVSGPLTCNETYSLAEKLGVPWVPVMFGPYFPTREFPNPFVMESNWFSWLNLFSFNFFCWAMWQKQSSETNAFRAELGLEPLLCRRGMLSVVEEKELLMIGAFHEIFIPTQRVPADWKSHMLVRNFLFVPKTPEDSLDLEVQEFLAKSEGTGVIYLGLGSMPAPPKDLMELVRKIVQTLEVKAVLCAGWSGVTNSELEEILVVKSCPHDLLFPKCKVILHHAGVGTCAAALRSGVPSVCLPVLMDQFSNANQLAKLGVAPPSIPFRNVPSSHGAVLEAVRFALESVEMMAKAQEMSRRLEESDGTALCVEKILQTYFE
ncbi:Sterol 3-beta-glucosyltransferase UGT80B1 (Protein TRANSPARENT TESTA 15) (UDP-glucose:sterol glucosyltransferase 80B1) [Durusdinium trenchii]